MGHAMSFNEYLEYTEADIERLAPDELCEVIEFLDYNVEKNVGLDFLAKQAANEVIEMAQAALRQSNLTHSTELTNLILGVATEQSRREKEVAA